MHFVSFLLLAIEFLVYVRMSLWYDNKWKFRFQGFKWQRQGLWNLATCELWQRVDIVIPFWCLPITEPMMSKKYSRWNSAFCLADETNPFGLKNKSRLWTLRSYMKIRGRFEKPVLTSSINEWFPNIKKLQLLMRWSISMLKGSRAFKSLIKFYLIQVNRKQM